MDTSRPAPDVTISTSPQENKRDGEEIRLSLVCSGDWLRSETIGYWMDSSWAKGKRTTRIFGYIEIDYRQSIVIDSFHECR